MIQVAGLKFGDAFGGAHGCGCDPVRADAIDQLSVTGFPEATAQIEGSPNEEQIVELVEVPLLIQEPVNSGKAEARPLGKLGASPYITIPARIPTAPTTRAEYFTQAGTWWAAAMAS